MNHQSMLKDNNQQQQQYQQDYNEEEQNLDQVVIQSKQPQELVVSLSENNVNSVQTQGQEKGEKIIIKLKQILNFKIEQAKTTKKRVDACKKEIKSIGEEVDRQMNKSILKHSKPHPNIDIQSIFKAPRNTDPQINSLNTELAKIRNQSKKLKNQIKILQSSVLAPINMINNEKVTQIKSKMKDAQSELKKLKQQKQFLTLQLKKFDGQEGQMDELGEQQLKSNKIKNSNILNQIKQLKNNLYDIQKQDRIITQKIRYFEELETQTETRKSRPTISSIMSKSEIQESIKKLIQSIQQTIEKRNKIENQRKNILKSLQTQVSNLQTQNWQIINKLREIDAQLIRHYNSRIKKPKVRKDSPKQSNKSVDQKQKQLSTSIKAPKTVYIMHKNDKNKQTPLKIEKQKSEINNPPQQFMQKRKTYQFFMSPNENTKQNDFGNVILSDESFGPKLSIKNITFILDDKLLYGMYADYINEHGNQVKGYKIISRIKPKQSQSKIFFFDNQKRQVINFIHVGIDDKQYIKYFHLITSQGKEFKWGSLEDCKRHQQKNVRKYESINIKGKLNQIGDKEAPNYYCLGGIGLTTVYLSAK